MGLRVPPLGPLARAADALMMPLMYVLAGTFAETPQRTHRWNNRRLARGEAESLDLDTMVMSEGIPSARPRWRFGLPLFHLPIIGGWKEYVVIVPVEPTDGWHVGWITPAGAGVSRIPLRGPVRVLLGPEPVSFFGLDTAGTQIPVRELARGAIGDRGPHARLPLF